MNYKPEIAFSHHYPKLHNQVRARLLKVAVVDVEKLDPAFVHYDTVYIERDGLFPQIEKHYPLPASGKVIVLFFVGNLLIPFSTVRRWTPEKERWYTGMTNMVFEVKIGH